MSGQGWKDKATSPTTALPSRTADLIYPLTHQGRWAHWGLELSLVGGPVITSPVVPFPAIPPEGGGAP